MQEPFSSNYNKVCDIQTKGKGSVIIIEDQTTHQKFVQKIIPIDKDINSFVNCRYNETNINLSWNIANY